MKRRIGIAMMFFFLSGMFFVPNCQAAQQQMVVSASGTTITGIKIAGQAVSFPDIQPFVDSSTSRTMVPISFIAKALGATVDWNANLQTITVIKGTDVIAMRMGSPIYVMNGKEVTFDASPQLYSGRTMVPLGIVSELLGFEVVYNSVTPPTPAWANNPDLSDLFKEMLAQVPGVEQTTLPKNFVYKNPNLNARVGFTYGKFDLNNTLISPELTGKLDFIQGNTVNCISVGVWNGNIGRYKFEPEIRTILVNFLRPALGDMTEEIVQALDDKAWGPPIEYNFNGMLVKVTWESSKDVRIWY